MKIPKLFILAIFIFLATAQEQKSKIKEITADQLDDLPILPSLVLFYYERDEPSEKLLEEYEKIWNYASNSWMSVRLYKMKSELEDDYVKKWSIKSLPCIKMVIDGLKYDYFGALTANDIFKQVQSTFKKRVMLFNDARKLDQLIAQERRLVVHFSDEYVIPNDIKSTFTFMIEQYRNEIYFAVYIKPKDYSDPMFDKYSKKTILFTDFYPYKFEFQGSTVDELRVFLSKNSWPAIANLNLDLIEWVQKRKEILFVCVIVSDDEADVVEELRNADIKDYKVAIFNGNNKRDPIYKIMSDRLLPSQGFSRDQIFIQDFSQDYRFFKMEEPVSASNLKAFHENFNKNLLRSLLRSEPEESRDNSGLVKRLVGRNFKAATSNPEFDVYVYFYFENCGEPCENILALFERVAEELTQFRYVKFYKINLSLNDLPNVVLEYLPSFGVYKRNEKERLVLYDEDSIDVRKILDFVNQQSIFVSSREYEEIKNEAEKIIAEKGDEIYEQVEEEKKQQKINEEQIRINAEKIIRGTVDTDL